LATTNIYGIWGNALINNIPVFNTFKGALKGWHFRFKWRDYEIAANVFNSAYVTDQFQKALDAGLPITFEMFIASTDGTATPNYVYGSPYLVPKITTDKGGIYPHYLNSTFKTRFNNLYSAINSLLASLSSTAQAQIKSWESDEGTTGDTGNYKGTIVSVTINGVAQSAPFTAYEITDAQWSSYKQDDVWPDWYADIQSNISFCSPLINTGNDGEFSPLITGDLLGAWNKTGNPTHNFNLPGEYYTKQRLQTVIGNATNVNRARGELEETPVLSWWVAAKKSCLSSVVWSCIDQGIDMLNIALNYLSDMLGTDTSFIEKVQPYFGVRNVSETNVGFCKFRKVINITDTTLYPVGTYGDLVAASDLSAYTTKYNNIASNSSLNTYQKQAQYVSLLVSGKSGGTYVNPARLSALQAAFPDAAFRALSTAQEQDSRNMDYGVYMIDNNYGKYVTQYDPEATSKRYWRLYDTTDYYGRFLRGFDTANSKNTIYLSSTLFGNNNYHTTIKVTYLNSGTNQWSLKYYNGSAMVSAGTITNTNTNAYVTHTFTITDFQGGGHLLHSTDIILNNENATDTKFDLIEVVRVSQNSGTQNPTANAGADVFVTLPTTTAQLDGSESAAGSGTITTYLWEQTSGIAATIVSPNSAITNITGLTAGARDFQLTVTNSDALTNSDTVSIFVSEAPPPTANAGIEQTLPGGTTSTTLHGGGTGTSLTYLWEVVTGEGITIESPNSASTQVTGLKAGENIFQLTVTDDTDRQASDGVVITVEQRDAPIVPPFTSIYSVVSSKEYARMVSAVIIDARAQLPIKNKIGSVIKSYIDTKLAAITTNTLVYGLQTENCNLVGYFTLIYNNGSVVFGEKLLRPAFLINDTDIQALITNFITTSQWNGDILL